MKNHRTPRSSSDIRRPPARNGPSRTAPVDTALSSPVEWKARAVLTAFGVSTLTFMMAMYALEHRNERFVVAFAAGCALSSAYGFLAGTWPFGVVEAIWTAVALGRWRRSVANSRRRGPPRGPTVHN